MLQTDNKDDINIQLFPQKDDIDIQFKQKMNEKQIDISIDNNAVNSVLNRPNRTENNNAHPTPSPHKKASVSPYVGKTCPFCQYTIKPTDEISVCPECNTPHHAECVQMNEGKCTTFGCKGNMKNTKNQEAKNGCAESIGISNRKPVKNQETGSKKNWGIGIAAIALIGIIAFTMLGSNNTSRSSKQEPTRGAASSVPNPTPTAKEPSTNEVIDVSFQSGGGNSGIGKIVIRFKKNGVIRQTSFEGKSPKVFEKNGEKLLVLSESLYANWAGSRAYMPHWDDIYRFDVATEDLIIVSQNYPEYYRDNYIPFMNSRIGGAASDTITGRKVYSALIKAADELISGIFIPDKEHRLINDRVRKAVSQ